MSGNTIKPKVLITIPSYSPVAIGLLREKCEVTVTDSSERPEILRKSSGMDAILWATHCALDNEALEAAGPQLRSISLKSAGCDYVDVPAVRARGITLGNTAGVLSDAVADLAVGLLLAAARRFHEGRQCIESGTWKQKSTTMFGRELKSATVGIVGFGGIGHKIAQRLRGFKVARFLYSGRRVNRAAEDFGAERAELDALLEQSDFVVIACPLTAQTRHLIDARALQRMKSTAVLVNVARGEIIDQDALVEALRSNRIFAAGLDVTTPEPLPVDHPLLALPNCVIVPHLGSCTERTRENMEIVAAQNILNSLSGEPMVCEIGQ